MLEWCWKLVLEEQWAAQHVLSGTARRILRPSVLRIMPFANEMTVSARPVPRFAPFAQAPQERLSAPIPDAGMAVQRFRGR